jgi:hypothetical protein
MTGMGGNENGPGRTGSTPGPAAEQGIQGFDNHARDGVAVLIGILQGPFRQPAGNVDDNLLGIVITGN